MPDYNTRDPGAPFGLAESLGDRSHVRYAIRIKDRLVEVCILKRRRYAVYEEVADGIEEEVSDGMG